ncbi:hypothetical protein ACONUD_08190 [Microbulbifer harenosus]|uniref:DUF3558 domain-containing protein n=1 Tax=Microbulbifer harenosus TaxID=2576840 RepID=A0ABY2UF40_9GAMM|nr:hypothetical protein [Microbulbifer harenosus]TLM76183.1 hypothetical protein FDY93_14575 [Microbulbifer harenosus]
MKGLQKATLWLVFGLMLGCVVSGCGHGDRNSEDIVDEETVEQDFSDDEEFVDEEVPEPHLGDNACDLVSLAEVSTVFGGEPARITDRVDVGQAGWQLSDATSCIWRESPGGVMSISLPVYYEYPRPLFEGVFAEALKNAEAIPGIGEEAHLTVDSDSQINLFIYDEPMLLIVKYGDDTNLPAARVRDELIALGAAAFQRAALSAQPVTSP